MNNHSTLQSWESLDRSTLKKAGSDELHGPCPVTGNGKDCFWIQPERKGLGCRSCSADGGKLDGPQYKAHLESLGMTFGANDVIRPYDWTDPVSGAVITQTRHAGEPKYRWPKGTKTHSLVYLARYERTSGRALLFCEGGPAAIAAASKLPVDDFDVIGFVSASKIPSAATLAEIAKGRSCVIWPDDDDPGKQVGRKLLSALRLVAADVVTVDPALLGLTGGHGHDAAEWHPGDSPVDELRAACGTVQPITKAHRFKLVWDIETQPDPRAVVPGLLYEGYQTVIEAGPKWGKTTMIVDAVASAYASGEWLGESCDEPGPILWISEMAEPLIRAWLARRLPEGVKPNIYVSPICSLTELASAVEEIHPCAVIVDSFIAAFRAERPGAGKPDEWRAGDVREFFTRLREICPTSLTTNHVRKSDGAGRDSGDLHAAVDLLIELRDEKSNRHYISPDLRDRRRTLHYAGRILHGRVTHCQMGEDFGFSVVDGGNTSGGGGGSDTFTVGETVDPLDETVLGYIMQHPKSSGRKIREAIGCHQRDLQPSLARLSAAVRITSEDGPRKAKLWSVATSVPTGPNHMFGPVGPVGTLNENGGKTDKQDRVVRPVQTLSKEWTGPVGTLDPSNHWTGEQRLPLAVAKTTMPPITRGGIFAKDRPDDLSIPTPHGGEPAERGDPHDAECPGGCSGTGAVDGKACDWGNYLEDRRQRRLREDESVVPVHRHWPKKWSNASKRWVPATRFDFGDAENRYCHHGWHVPGNVWNTRIFTPRNLAYPDMEDHANAENNTH